MTAVLPLDRLEWVEGWGMAVGAAGYVFRPTTVDGIRSVLELARERGVPVVLRGKGRSYGDAALLPEGVVLDLSHCRRVLAWDPETGVIDVEPGVTVEDLWRCTIGDGWWPPVVTGTMKPTLGGALAMNAHGKNAWQRGPIGEHCLELDLLLPSGQVQTIGPDREPDLFHAVIGGFGQLGVVTRARLAMQRVASGRVKVEAVAARDLEAMIREMEDAKDRWEYLVGWIDAFPGGRRLGRGLIHFARHLEPGEDPTAAQTLRADRQDLPDRIMGIVPKSVLWRLLRPLTNQPGMRIINAVKYRLGTTVGADARYEQSLAEFSFLLDFVPGWKDIYLPGGLIQHQSFVPVDRAHDVFAAQLQACRDARLPSFLAVLKRHRPDPFLLTHGLDGYSLALDFPVTATNKTRLWRLVRTLGELTVEAGGRFYPAKDAALPGELYRASFTGGELERFTALKARVDPEHLLCSALADRLLDPQ